MKRIILLFASMMLGLTLSAQTQQGYVKTKGRMVNGQIVHGQGLKGATVSIKGRTTVLVNTDDGAFSFPVPETQFRIDSVRKKGYQLVDMDALSKTYKHSANPIYLVMETPEQLIDDKMENFKKINAAQQVLISQLREEVKQLKATNKITEEEYCRRLSEIANMQMESQDMVSEMAERYSKIDFDQLDEFNRQISLLIMNGELKKVDSLINAKGNMDNRRAEYFRLREANKLEEHAIEIRQENLESSRALEYQTLEEIGQDCYYHFETNKLRHQNDSAAYWIEYRASLDSSKVEWSRDAGGFNKYIGKYDVALRYCQSFLNNAILMYGEPHQITANAYNDIGCVYQDLADYDNSIKNHKKALTMRLSLFGEMSHDVAISYNNIATCYADQGKLKEALEFLKKSLSINISLLGKNDADVALAYHNIGEVYCSMYEFDSALFFLNEALSIRQSIFEENSSEMGVSYNSIGSVYYYKLDYCKSLEYFEKALEIDTIIYGELNPSVAIVYNNIGAAWDHCHTDCPDSSFYFTGKALQIRKNIYGDSHPYVAASYHNIGTDYAVKGDYETAVQYYTQALSIRLSVFGENNPDVAATYGCLGNVFTKQGKYEDAYYYLNKALSIRKNYYGENHVKTGFNYIDIGNYFYTKGDYVKALENYETGSAILRQHLEENHPSLAWVIQRISEIQSKLKEQENPSNE